VFFITEFISYDYSGVLYIYVYFVSTISEFVILANTYFFSFYTFLESARIIETNGPGTMRVRAGTTVSLNCKAEGHPEPAVTWAKIAMGR